MLQVLDYFRRLYKQETKKSYRTEYPETASLSHEEAKDVLTHPTWGYVCWLEARLANYEQEPLPETVVTVATSQEFENKEGRL